MRRGFPSALAALAVTLALAACTGSPEPPPPPTADELARSSYERIVSGANALLMGDHLGWFGTGDAVERVGVGCLDDTCTAAFERSFDTSDFSVESLELEPLGERRGVSLIVEEASGEYADVRIYGGWLEHSLFATESVLLKNEIYPDRGATLVLNYSIGFSTQESPSTVDGSARWEGLMLGRDMSASPGRGQVIRGDADVTVEFGGTNMTADVEFTDIANTETGERRDDMTWHGMVVEQGGFARQNAPTTPSRVDSTALARRRSGACSSATASQGRSAENAPPRSCCSMSGLRAGRHGESSNRLDSEGRVATPDGNRARAGE